MKAGEGKFKVARNSFFIFPNKIQILFFDVVRMVVRRRNLPRILSTHHRFFISHIFRKPRYYGNGMTFVSEGQN